MSKRSSLLRYVALTAGATVVLTACDSMNDLIGQDQVDYKSTVRGAPLTLPPDLSSSQLGNPQYTAPGEVVSASAYAASQQANATAAQRNEVLPQVAGMQVLRSGDTRWLQIDADPNTIYPRLITFWESEGFTISRDNPQAGIIETDWAENRAKIPGNFLRRVLGSIVDVVSDSGERERFVTRLERHEGRTEVYINHSRMVETAMDRDATTFKWLPAPEDPGLNAVMLSRLMVFLGQQEQQAQDAVRHAQAVAATVAPAGGYRVDAASNTLSLPFARDDTWRRLGTALHAAGFTIDASDLSQGTYVVRYLDTDTGEKRQAGNFLSRLWGDHGNITPLPYTLHVSAQGSSNALIRVFDEQGQADTSQTATRILQVVADNFR